MVPGVGMRLSPRVQVMVYQRPIPASLVGPSLRGVQQAVRPEQKGQLALDRRAPLHPAGPDQASRQGFLRVCRRSMLTMQKEPSVAGALPGCESGSVDLQPEMPDEVRGARRQCAGLVGGGAGVKELDQGVSGQLPAFRPGAPFRMVRSDLIEPCGLERFWEGWGRGGLALAGQPAQSALVAPDLPRPSELAQAPEQSGKNVFAFKSGKNVFAFRGAADVRRGRAALGGLLFLDVCLLLLLLCRGVCVPLMTVL